MKKWDLGQVWRDIEDFLVPYLRLDIYERVLYYHLLRHSRVEGKGVICISKKGLTESTGLSYTCVLRRIPRLAQKGCLRILERNFRGHMIEVRTPTEVPGCVRAEGASGARGADAANCMKRPELREAIVLRERGRCFYCLRRLQPHSTVLDHVVPKSQSGDDSYRNVVACCYNCNRSKHELPAGDFLELLYRKGTLTGRELARRRAALKTLVRGTPRLNLHKEELLRGWEEGKSVGGYHYPAPHLLQKSTHR